MKYFKMVSGKGRVEMSEKEISEMLGAANENVMHETSQFEALEQKVESLSKTIEALSKTEVFKALLALTKGLGENDGAS